METLKKLVNLSKVDLKAADEEISYWIINNLEYMKYKMLPTVPLVMNEYYASGVLEKRRVNSNKEFWFRKDVSDYLEQKMNIKNHNLSNLYWMRWAKGHIPEPDIPSHEKLKTAIYELDYKIHNS